jgi:hypothetical protein
VGTSAWPMCDGFGRNFSTVARKQAPTVRKAADGREMRWRPGGRPGSVRSTTLATLAEQNRCHGGPRFCSTTPGPEPPLLPSFISFWAGHSVETSAEPRCDGYGRKLFSRRPQAGTDGQESGGREGNAIAARTGGPGRYTGISGRMLPHETYLRNPASYRPRLRKSAWVFLFSG